MEKEESRWAAERGARNGREKPRAAEVRRMGRERSEKAEGRRAVVAVEEERREVVWRVRRKRRGRRSIVG